MPSQIKSFNPKRRVATRSKNKNKIMAVSKKELEKTRAYMRPLVNKANYNVKFGTLPDKQFPSKNINIGQSSPKIVNHSAAKGASKSNHVPTPMGMKPPTTSSFGKCVNSVEKQNINIGQSSAKIVNHSAAKGASKSNHVPTPMGPMGMKPPTSNFRKCVNSVEPKQNALSQSSIDEEVRLKETRSLKRKGEVNDASQRPPFKAMSGLVLKKTGKIVYYSDDSSSRLKKQASSKKELDITTKLEFLKGCAAEGNERQDKIVIDKDNVKEFGEKATDTLDLILSNIHCTQKIQRDKQLFLDGNHSMKKRNEPLFEENYKSLDNVSNVDNMSCRPVKKLRQSLDDTVSISNNDHAKVSMSSCVERQCYSCLKPIDKLTWSGIFKTDDKKYVSLDGHLSTKSCEKAWNLSSQLLKVVEVQKISRLEVWPKAWEGSTPTGNNIGIYFFPHEMRQDEVFDQLIKEVMENDLALRSIIGEAEILIFPSILLPNHHQTFQKKHYLWGVFKHRQDKGVMVEELLNAMGHCEKEKQQNLPLDQPNNKLSDEEPNQNMIWMESTIPLERHMFSPNRSTQEVEASCLKRLTKKGFDLKAPGEEGGHAETLVTTDGATFPTSHGQTNPSMGHTQDRLMGFVVRKTSKLDRIIREIEQEGALIFAMQGDMVSAGSWAVNKATQK